MAADERPSIMRGTTPDSAAKISPSDIDLPATIQFDITALLAHEKGQMGGLNTSP